MPAGKQMLEELRDQLRGRFLPYLRRAFQWIPPMTKPRILDIGCGSGVPTIELAHLSGGDLTGIDIDSDALKRLEKRARAAGLTGRVHIVHGSVAAAEKLDNLGHASGGSINSQTYEHFSEVT